MKAVQTSTFLMLLMTMTGCGPHQQRSQPVYRAYISPANESGFPLCSNAMINDTRAFQSKGMDVLNDTAKTMSSTVDLSKSSGISSKLAEINQSLETMTAEYVSKYGSTPCEFYEDGQLIRIDPSKITALAHQPVKAKVEALDGVCPEQLTADHRESVQMTKGIAVETMRVLGSMLQKVLAGQPHDAEKALVSKNGQIVLDMQRKFRNKHPGKFSCSSTTEAGDKEVISSEELDQNLIDFERNLAQMVAK